MGDKLVRIRMSRSMYSDGRFCIFCTLASDSTFAREDISTRIGVEVHFIKDTLISGIKRNPSKNTKNKGIQENKDKAYN